MEIEPTDLTVLENARAVELIRENWKPLAVPEECESCGQTTTTTQVGGVPACSLDCAIELAEHWIEEAGSRSERRNAIGIADDLHDILDKAQEGVGNS